jgi:hypothetical protein
MKFFTVHNRNGGKYFVSAKDGKFTNPPLMTDFYDYGFSFAYEWDSKAREWKKTGVAPETVNIIGMVVDGHSFQYFHFELGMQEKMDNEKIPYVKKNEFEVLVDTKHLPTIWEIVFA